MTGKLNMKKFLTRYFPEIILIICAILLSGYIALSPTNSLMNWYDSDDGFYYFKVAQNIIAGHGVTFDGVNPANGFHPLWMILCLVIFSFVKTDLITPLRVIVVLFGIAQAVSAVLIYHVIRRNLPKLISFILTLCFVFARVIFNNIFSGGLESALGFLLLVLLWSKVTDVWENRTTNLRPYFFIGLLAALMVLSRLDLVIIAGILGIWIAFDRKADASLLLIDLTVTLALVILMGTIRTDYTLFPYEESIILSIGILGIVGIISNWLFGMFSAPSRIPVPRKNIFLAGAISGGLTAGVLIVITFGLHQLKILPYLPRSIVLLSAAGWLIYTTTIRAWITRRVYRKTVDYSPVSANSIRAIFLWMRRPLAYFIPILILVGIYFAWNQINFGTMMPVSGQIKHWWGTLSTTIYGSPIHSQSGFNRYIYGSEAPFQFLYSIVYPITAPLRLPNFDSSIAAWSAVLGAYLILLVYEQKNQIASWWNKLGVLPLGSAVLFHVLYFYLSGYVHMRVWYWLVEAMFVFVLLLSIIGVWYQMYPESRFIRGMITFLIIGVAISAGNNLMNNILRKYPPKVSQEHAEDYRATVWLIEKFTPVNSIIATPGGGTLSYLVENRRIVNLDGLMNSPEYFEELKTFDTSEFMAKNNIQYVYANEIAVISSPPYAAIFANRLEPIGRVYGKTLYKYLPKPVN